jgi:hypothetical protein
MKVIFLDHDGVLNAADPATGPLHRCGFLVTNVRLVERLNRLLDRTDAKIVLSTSWRDDGRWLDCVTEAGFRHSARLIGMTPKLTDGTRSIRNRGSEIRSWLSDWTGEPIETFVILEDETLEEGLTEEHVERALRLLATS